MLPDELIVHPHYHDTQKGCELYEIREKSSNTDGDAWKLLWCETHQSKVCFRDGWEFGWHDGTPSHKKFFKEIKIFKQPEKYVTS